MRHLTGAEIAAANKVRLSELRDPQTLAERTKPGKEQWLITLGVCTHLGCVPLGAAEGENRGELWRLFLPLPRLVITTPLRAVRKGPAPQQSGVPDYEIHHRHRPSASAEGS
jgi:ubiquinol-cytochrome c reductase iron-sulfur subunit